MSNLAPTVGIVTVVGRFNYGNRLQNLATARAWERCGFAPRTYGYYAKTIIWPIPRMALTVALIPNTSDTDRSNPERTAAFDRFDSRYLDIRRLDRLPLFIGRECDLFSVGSDQIWAPCGRGLEPWRFLEFAPREKRVALAPSMGVTETPEFFVPILKRGISGFHELSVREEDGAQIIRQVSGLEPTVLCDPTLLFTAPEWRALADSRFTSAEPYIFAYLLGDDSPERAELVRQLADGRRVVRISDCDPLRQELPAGPAEFIDLVDHAALVVTDSFHGSVFATLLSTPLVVVPRVGGEHMSGRIDTLAAKLGLARVPVGEGAPGEPWPVSPATSAGGDAVGAAPAAPAEMTGGASPDAPSPADWLVPTEATPELLAAERRRFARYLAGVLDARGYAQQAALARAAWGVSCDGRAAGAAEAEGAHERLPREELR